MIELDNITIALPAGKPGATDILCDISLRIEPGDWLAVTGPNGSGKTTLLNAIAGLVPPRLGRIDRAGAPVVGLLLQEPDNQFVASTVANELALSVSPAVAGAERAARIAEAADRFVLAAYLERNPHRLSGGEKQRLAFATVWLADPDIVLLDEPDTHLDREGRERCLRFVRGLNDKGTAIVWTTHSPADIREAGTVVTLEGGRVISISPASEFAVRDQAALDTEPMPPAPDGATALVTFDNVTFSYDTAPVLTGVDFAARGGWSTGVTGPNGCGKSTLLALASGILDPGGGRIERAFKSISEDARQNVFHLFENPERLFFAETVFEEVAFGLEALGRPRKLVTQHVADSLSRVGLDPETFAGRVPFSLSAGEMRRLAFAVALALEPRLLVLDEPSSSLDVPGRRVLHDMIRWFVSQGTAVVMATHDGEALARDTHEIVELEAPPHVPG